MATPRIDILLPYALSDLQQQALQVWIATVCSYLEERRPFHRRNQRYHDRVRDQRELLLLRLQLWMNDLRETSPLYVELAALRETIQQRTHKFWQVRVEDGHQFETEPITQSAHPFTLDLQAWQPTHWESDQTTLTESEHLLAVMGALPKHRIEITALLEDLPDQMLAVYMAADLAKHFRGWVKLHVRPQFFTDRAAQAWSAADARAIAQQLNGTAHEIPLVAGGAPAYFLADYDFARSWAQHPKFALVPVG